MTPLHCAAQGGSADITRRLLAGGADVNALTTLVRLRRTPPHAPKSLMSPLHVAAEEGHADVVAVLVDSGADVNLKTAVPSVKRAP